MGVKGLQYYVDNCCPELCRTVSIKDLADRWKCDFKTEPVLVVDGMSLMHKLYAGHLDWVCGGQWREFVAVIANFVQKFREIGVKLVVFFDGTVCTTKRSEWVSRRVRKYNEVSYIFRYIKSYNTEPDQKYFQLPTSMGTLTRFIYKFYCNVEVSSTCRECDQEIAKYARDNSNVFAILSQDSDFLIYNTKDYISSSHLNLENMTTVLYDRDGLAHHLGLHLEQLPIFSCLVGNDTITKQMLSAFYSDHFGRLWPQASEVIPIMARLIRENNWWGNVQNPQELLLICKNIFLEKPPTEMLKVLYESLEVYSLQNDCNVNWQCDLVPSDLNSLLLRQHISCETSPVIFNLLHNLVFDSTEVVEDCTDRSLPPAALVYRCVRKRMYGLLLSSSRFANSSKIDNNSQEKLQMIHFKEWCAYNGNMLHAPDLVKATPMSISGFTPNLQALWCGGSEAQALRFETFLVCMGLKTTTKMLLSIPSQFITLCSILQFLILYRPCLLTSWELKAFIAQAVSPKASDFMHLARIKISRLESRGIHLTSIFMRGVVTVLAVLGICGNPFPAEKSMPWHFFDGKLFQQIYVYAKDGASVKDLCDHNEHSIAMFYRLLNVVITGTPFALMQSSFH